MASQGATGTVTVDADHDDGASFVQIGINPAVSCTAPNKVFSTATSTTWPVPPGCDTVTVKAWGAGGGGGAGGSAQGGAAGGGAGFAQAEISVTPSETLVYRGRRRGSCRRHRRSWRRRICCHCGWWWIRRCCRWWNECGERQRWWILCRAEKFNLSDPSWRRRRRWWRW